MRHRWIVLLAACALAWLSPAHATDACGSFAQKLASTRYADRIAGQACNESILWHRAFIDADGRLPSTTVMEAEKDLLSDGATQAWTRVAAYWRDSGVLARMAGIAGSGDCLYAGGERWQSASCRAFLVDNPWSAAFVSWLMVKTGVPGFRPSGSHVDYVRDAYRGTGPYRYADPFTTAAKAGDLLCFVRSPNRVFGPDGLRSFFAGDGGALNMHCDVVVGADAAGEGLLTLVGGNVVQGVTLRRLPLNRNGLLWGVPRRGTSDPACSPEYPKSCDMNRQDWAALLQLADLPPAPPPQLLPGAPVPGQTCCTVCIVGGSVPRCPKDASAAPATPAAPVTPADPAPVPATPPGG